MQLKIPLIAKHIAVKFLDIYSINNKETTTPNQIQITFLTCFHYTRQSFEIQHLIILFRNIVIN